MRTAVCARLRRRRALDCPFGISVSWHRDAARRSPIRRRHIRWQSIRRENQPVCARSRTRQSRSLLGRIAVLASAMAMLLAACRPEQEPPAPEIRPVRAVTIEKRDTSVPVVLTGSIQAEDQAPLAFRIAGRMIERTVNLGDRVRAGQVVARLDTQNERNALRTARANLTATQGQLTQRPQRAPAPRAARGTRRRRAGRARPGTGRRSRPRRPRSTPRRRSCSSPSDQLGFTDLKADAAGVVTGDRRRARRGGTGRADDRHAGPPGRTGRGLRRARPGDPLGAADVPDHGVADRRSGGDRDRAHPRGGAAGRPGHPDLRGEGRA